MSIEELQNIKKDLKMLIDYQHKRTKQLYAESDQNLYRKGFAHSKILVEDYINEKIEELKQRQDMLF
jgi:virulence-associated protein VapD